jgi:hypothetical protein
VVVASSKGGQVTQAVDSNGVLWSRVTDGTSVTSDGSGEDIVSGFTTYEETIPTDDGVSGEGWALYETRARGWVGKNGRQYIIVVVVVVVLFGMTRMCQKMCFD